MAVEAQDVEKIGEPTAWKDYEKIVKSAEGVSTKLTKVARQQFYDRAKKAYAIVATSDSALYANIILKKGVVQPVKKTTGWF
jgi:L-fucose mutarotase